MAVVCAFGCDVGLDMKLSQPNMGLDYPFEYVKTYI